MHRGAITAVWLGLAACTSGPESPATAGGVCEASAGEAKKRVSEVVPTSLECKVDDDCQAVLMLASCFNECAVAVNRKGAGAVDRAATLVEAHECKEFAKAGCKSPEKQCLAPPKARCLSGTCAL